MPLRGDVPLGSTNICGVNNTGDGNIPQGVHTISGVNNTDGQITSGVNNTGGGSIPGLSSPFQYSTPDSPDLRNNRHPTPNSSIHFTPMMEYGGLIATGQGKMILSLCHEDITLSLEIIKNTSEIITAHSSKYMYNGQNYPNTNEKKSKNQNLSCLLMNR